jgi:protein SCO1/2
LLAALLSALLALPGCERAAAPPKFKGVDLTGASYGREFRLLDPDGRQRTLSDFKGKVVMLFFGYTQCPDVCPTALARASNLRQQLGSEADLLQVIFVTVDPERDTPEILKAYTGAFDPTFIGLHGDLASTATTAKEFRVYYAKMGTGTTYTMDHSAFTYLFDKQGHLRVALSHTQPTSDFAADIRTLLRSS